MTDWQPIETAPRDGTAIILDIGPGRARAYWDEELRTWVLCHPLHMESVREPKGWRPG